MRSTRARLLRARTADAPCLLLLLLTVGGSSVSRACHRATGYPKWTYDKYVCCGLKQLVVGPAALSPGGHVVFVAQAIVARPVGGTIPRPEPAHNLCAIDASTGAEMWCTDPEIPPAPVYQSLGHGDLAHAKPAVARDGSTVYSPSRDGRLYAIDVASGEKVWSFATKGNVTRAALAPDGLTVYFASTDGKVYAVAA